MWKLFKLIKICALMYLFQRRYILNINIRPTFGINYNDLKKNFSLKTVTTKYLNDLN